jgi:hypothetical protein
MLALRSAAVVSFLALILLSSSSCADRPSPSISSVERYAVFETSLRCDHQWPNPFTDAAATATFDGPRGQRLVTEGFFDGDAIWRFRFVPRELGRWSYDLVIAGAGGGARSRGVFDCIGGSGHGFLRIAKQNPYRFERDDGTPFYPVGQQVGWGIPPQVPFDGTDAQRFVPREQFIAAFRGCTNLIRSQLGAGNDDGLAIPIIAEKGDLDRYDLEACRRLDDSCRAIKGAGWAQVMTFFQDMSIWGAARTGFGSPRDLTDYKRLGSKHQSAMDRYIRYVVARWGTYVDIWELYNEDSWTPNDLLAHFAAVVRSRDPYRHPITTNIERPREAWSDLLSCHEYMGIPANEVPRYLAKEFARHKSYAKPVLYTEFGNQGLLGNVDDVKWRVATWTAFMNECALTMWNESNIQHPPTKGRPLNTWLGETARSHLRVFSQFVEGLPVDLRPVVPGFLNERGFDGWALGNGAITVLYLHHCAGHDRPVETGDIHLWTGPGRYRIRWIDPATGAALRTDEQTTPQYILELKGPAFTIDLAARVDRIDG